MYWGVVSEKKIPPHVKHVPETPFIGQQRRLYGKEYNAILVVQSGHAEAVQLTFILCIQTSKIQFMPNR